jgi:hypothetical protein
MQLANIIMHCMVFCDVSQIGYGYSARGKDGSMLLEAAEKRPTSAEGKPPSGERASERASERALLM